MSAIEHVAIVGSGFSGTLQAIALLRGGVRRVSLIERREEFGRGIAYSTSNPAHLLNVRTSNMSAFVEEPDHFRRWLAQRAPASPDGFASRRDFGDYLSQLLEETIAAAPGRLDLWHDGAVEIDRRATGVRLLLDGGRRIDADAAILAIGNLPPHDPPGLDPARLPPDLYVADPLGSAIGEGLAPDHTVLLIGTGLTMIDVVLTLEEEGFGGRIVALSRHGLVRRAHDAAALPACGTDRPRAIGAALLGELRRQAERSGWRTAVDGIRPFTQDLWHEASPTEQARFIRHLRAWWDVHRHRLAPEVAARLAAWRGSGRLEVVAGRIEHCTRQDQAVEVAWRPRGTTGRRQLQVRRIVNCTGPQGDLLRTREPLLHLLLASGRVRPDRHRLGIDVNRYGETIGVDGRPNPRLLAVGPMTRGAFWESVAVPDIRVQTAALARHLVGSGA